MVVERYPQSGPYSPKRLKQSVERTSAKTTLSYHGEQQRQQEEGKHRVKKKFRQFFSCLPHQQRRYYQEEDHPDSPTSTIPLMMEEDLSISNNPYYDSAASEVGDPSSTKALSSPPRSASATKAFAEDDHRMTGVDDDQCSDIKFISNDNQMIESSGSDHDREGVMLRWKSRINHCLKKALHQRRLRH